MDIDADIIKAVDKLYGVHSLPIYPEKICKAVCRKVGIDPYGFPPGIIENALEEDDNYVPVVSNGEDDELYFFSRRGLFDKAQFCIRPSALEIEQGILIPGHRFIPFFDRDSDIKLTSGSKPGKIKKIKRQIPVSKLSIYYSLFGPKGAMELIVAENPENLFAFMDEIKHGSASKDAIADVMVYDLKDFYATNKIVEGDLLELTIVDYKKNLCSIERLPEDRLWQSAKWESMFEQGLRESIELVDQFGAMESIEVFLSRAFFLADHSLLQSPSSLPVNVLNKRDYLYLAVSESGRALIWEKDREFDLFEEDELDDEDFESDEDFMYDKDSELNKLFQTMGFSIDENELAAYMRDELFSGGDNLDNVKKRCFDDRVYQLFPDLQKDFNKAILNLWKATKKEYNIFRDNPQGKIRKKALELLDAHTAWIRKLDTQDISPSRELEEEFKKIMQLLGPVSGLAIFFNIEQKISEKDIQKYFTMLDLAMESHAGMIKGINKMLGIK